MLALTEEGSQPSFVPLPRPHFCSAIAFIVRYILCSFSDILGRNSSKCRLWESERETERERERETERERDGLFVPRDFACMDSASLS